MVSGINDSDAAAALEAERALVTALGGGCQMPIGGIAVPLTENDLELHAVVASLDGARAIRYKKVGRSDERRRTGPARWPSSCCAREQTQILKEARQNQSLIPNPESLRLT